MGQAYRKEGGSMRRQRRSITDIVCENCIYRVTHRKKR
ncbi:TPA: NinE family protein, partial [Cronobacter sakazakii]|nr:NinE family protein [Cronobacter sakazakii]HDK7258505.1 NinE family protein [Cronobacter sakazakii]HDK7328380.1 NinE family protein [Cronobacter sakazakii]HDK7383332.1 NinE family protein [Cronobacter sakazakii]